MNKFFAKKQKNSTFSFYESDVNHILNVLRLSIEDNIIVNFESKRYLCKITNISPLLAEIINELPNNSDLFGKKITLFQSIIKPKNFELILTKSTELGINSIYPVIFNRTQFNNIEKHERYLNIINAACKQCGRTSIPFLNEVIKFENILEIIKEYDLVIVGNEHDCCNENDLFTLVVSEYFNNINNIAIITGPEGGFADFELEILSKITNIKFVGLTKNILRSETASLYALSIVIGYFIYKGNC